MPAAAPTLPHAIELMRDLEPAYRAAHGALQSAGIPTPGALALVAEKCRNLLAAYDAAQPETVTLTLTRAQLAAVRGALDSCVEARLANSRLCAEEAETYSDDEDPREQDANASAARWQRLADEAISALAVVEAVAQRVFAETPAA